MEIIKRKISLDDYISKDINNWGELTVKNFKLNIFIKDKFDDMGIFSDLSFIPLSNTKPNYQILINKLNDLGLTFNFMLGGTFTPLGRSLYINERNPNYTIDDYFVKGGNVSGFTEDRLDLVKSYDNNLVYKPLFDIDKGLYLNYDNRLINGVTRVNENINDLSPITYSIDAD